MSRDKTWDSPEKLTIEWGDKQAKALWDGFWSVFEVEWNGKSVLDFGCLWGHFPKFLLEEKGVREAIGIDIYPKWEGVSEWDYHSMNGLQLHAGDLTEIVEIQESEFDIITTSGTMFLLNPSKQEEVLTWMYDHLKPGGSLLVQTRTFFSYNGGDLHDVTSIPYPHVIFSERIINKLTYSRKLILMSATGNLMLFHRSGFDIKEVRRYRGIDEDFFEKNQEKLWFYSKRDLGTGDIYVHLVKPQSDRDISEMRQ